MRAPAAYRLLLRLLLPRALRDACGAEIEALFAAELHAARGRGRWARLAVWSGALGDVVRRAPYEHWRRRGRAGEDTPREAPMRPLHAFWFDLRFAARTFARQKGATALVVATLTLAVAANTAVFALLDGTFFRPLPFPHPERLVYLNERAPTWNLEFVGINYPDYAAWRRSARAFEAMALYEEESVNLADGAGAERVEGARVTRDFPATLGFRPLLGRAFTADEDRPDGPPVVAIGHALWRSRFAGAPDVVGRTLRIDSRPHTIVAVYPPEAEFPGRAQLWVPYRGNPSQTWQSYSGDGLARLKPGVTVAQARRDLDAAHAPVWAERDSARVVSPRLDPLRERLIANFQVMGLALGVSVALVLVIACANVAGAMLARATFRQREIAIRMASGASASRVARQLLTEALALAALAGALGTALGWLGLRALVRAMPEPPAAWSHPALDLRTAAFGVALVAVTAVLFGLVPALQARHQDVRECLNAGSARAGRTLRQRRVLDGLVVVEIALAAVLLVAGGLLAQAFAHVRDTDPGFRVDGVATFRVALPRATYPDARAELAFYQRLVERVRAIPGVAAAGAVTCAPLGGCHQGAFFDAEGGAKPAAKEGADPVVFTRTADAGYFGAMGIRLVRGRFFAEGEGSPRGFRPAVINESLARRLWPGVADPTGRRFRMRGDTAWVTAVGVARDVRHYGLDKPTRPALYFSTAWMENGSDLRTMTIVAHATAGVDAKTLFAPMRAAVRALDPELPLFELRTMRDAVSRSLTLRRVMALALGTFAAIALTLAVGGVYAVLSYVVGRRRREIGIRVALGARGEQVVGLVVRQGLRLVGVGLLLGIPAALAAARLLQGALVGVAPGDARTYLAAGALLALTAVLAALVPARRAASVAPTETLAEGQ